MGVGGGGGLNSFVRIFILISKLDYYRIFSIKRPGVYFKLGPVTQRLNGSRRLIGSRRFDINELIYYHPTSEARAKLVKTGRFFSHSI